MSFGCRLGRPAVWKRRIPWATLCSSGLLVALTSLAPALAEAQVSGLQISVLSNRPDMLSGGDALIRVALPAGVSATDVRVTLNGTTVTRMLRPYDSGRALIGVVSGLANGSNALEATAGGLSAARQTLVNHPIVGPVFAGPHEWPFICESEHFTLASGGTLGPALDEHCSVITRVNYVYRSTAGGNLKPLADPKAPPVDVAFATTLIGRRVPYIVRIETGTINRAIYQIGMLHDPVSEPAPDFVTRPAGWNGRLIYTFGGGCAEGWYRQGRNTAGIDDDVMLRQGYAVASASLNVGGNNCAQVLAAETMMMVKERFIEAYGAPMFTIGWGTSGGSYQQYQIADNYPGLLDGIITGRSFPDALFGTVPVITDTQLLRNYFEKLASVPYTDEQKRQIGGHGVLASMMTYDGSSSGRIAPMTHCPEVLPERLRYHPVNNPKGARCDVYSHAINTLGRDPQSGFARRPLDNVGIQYGLRVLNAGVITKGQFLELNEKIGGYDVDANIVSERTVADPMTVQRAYRSGSLTYGGNGLATTPIIDYRTYYDDLPTGEHHLRYHSLSTRARLMKANGHIENHVLLLEGRQWGGFSTRSPVLREALGQMDQWLTRLHDDPASDPSIVKLRRAKPAGLIDACWTPGENRRKVADPHVYGTGPCEELYPANSFPRGVADSSIAADVIKCQLKPLDPADYKVSFTAEEQTRLRQIFPSGTCDWSKPGVEQQPPAGTWQTFTSPADQTEVRR